MPPTLVLNTSSDRGKCLPRRLARNNVILWATASWLQHPGAILGREPTGPESRFPPSDQQHARLPSRYLPAFVGTQAFCLHSAG